MAWNIFTTRSLYKEGYDAFVSQIIMLFLFFIGVIFYSVHVHAASVTAKKSPHRSQFTEPPAVPFAAKLPCNVVRSTVKDAVNCFKNGQLKQANILFQSFKSQAIKTQNRPLLLKSYAYLALIAIEKGEQTVAVKKIKHLFFLHADFRLQSLGIKNKKYHTFFREVKGKGRNMNEKEVDDLSNIAFLRVKSCAGRYCKEGIWQPVKGHSIINYEINCSLQGSCLDDIKCSLEGSCNKKR